MTKLSRFLAILGIAFFVGVPMLSALPLTAYAIECSTPCTGTTICDTTKGQCTEKKACNPPACQSGLSTCNEVTGQCVAITQPTQPSGNSFVPLTRIPAITELGDSPTLPKFFNNLYKICIGAAAVLAVLQIVRAGFMYSMAADNMEKTRTARNLIGMSVGGLLLVLSPVIVFSVINPDILDLKLGVDKLSVTPLNPAPEADIVKQCAENCALTGKICDTAVGACVVKKACTPPTCEPGKTVCNEVTGKCVVPEENEGDDNFDPQQCKAYSLKRAVPPTSTCSAQGDGWTDINVACCANPTSGYKCCGVPEGYKPPAAAKYTWQARYFVSGAGGSTVTERAAGDTFYDSASACSAAYKNTSHTGHGHSGLAQLTCDCAKPVSDSSQISCPQPTR